MLGLERRLGLTVPVYIEVTGTTRPSVQSKQADDAILETYLKHANIAGYPEREARAMWSLFRTLTNGLSIAEATRDDGRKVVEHLQKWRREVSDDTEESYVVERGLQSCD